MLRDIRVGGTEAGIECVGVTKRFGAVTALDAVDVDVAPGEVVCLLGENGAGKSTLLRILGTTVTPDAGQVMVAGCDVQRDPKGARSAAGLVLGEERAWYLRLSGQQNLEFFAALHGLRRKDAHARAAKLLADLGLAEAADRRVSGYSSGMRARLSIARALLDDPPALLLDEPSRSLDPVATSHLRQLVRHLAENEQRAVLMATHDLHEAAEVSDRVVVLAHGRVVDEVAGATDAGALEATLVRVMQP